MQTFANEICTRVSVSIKLIYNKKKKKKKHTTIFTQLLLLNCNQYFQMRNSEIQHYIIIILL